MFAEFFQLGTIPSNQLIGNYDTRLVVLSFLVATSASYIALDLTGRLRDLNNSSLSRLLWLFGGAIAMGAGIWSMHFIGMLSFTIPGISLRYNLFWTGISLLVAIIASGFALYLLQASRVRINHYIAGGVILGLAIASMHYTGMEGLLISLDIHYMPLLFLASIIVAILASEAALWLALKSNQVIYRLRTRIKFVSAVIMGIAICGMHYTGMSASVFTPLCAPTISSDATGSIDPTYLSIAIASVTFIILAIAFLASTYKEALNQQQFEKARQLGMAEISASVLHNVGNVLNSVNVSVGTISEKIANSHLDDLEKICSLFNEHKSDLGSFITTDPRGIKSIEYLHKLSKSWHQEQANIFEEINLLNKNLITIKNIISTQQELSKTSEFEQILSISDLIEEAILITGLNLKNEIHIKRHYGKIQPIKTDKVKLLQIFVNLLRNAKESLLESKNPHMVVEITILKMHSNKIKIEISDNGMGIPAKEIRRVFNYGFTTKKTGHGFGLHTSAIAMNSLGGTIKATSPGVKQGAVFHIELPIQKK